MFDVQSMDLDVKKTTELESVFRIVLSCSSKSHVLSRGHMDADY